MVNDAVYIAELLASDYEKIAQSVEVGGNELNLNTWIASSLAKITAFSESELLEELDRSNRLGMLSLCSPEALEILNKALFEHMRSDRTRDRLREIQSCPVEPLAFYGVGSKVFTANLVSETFEYVEEAPVEPSIEFVDVDPETQAQILQMMA